MIRVFARQAAYGFVSGVVVMGALAAALYVDEWRKGVRVARDKGRVLHGIGVPR